MKIEHIIHCNSLEDVTTLLGATSYDARRIDRIVKNGGNDFTTSLGLREEGAYMRAKFRKQLDDDAGEFTTSLGAAPHDSTKQLRYMDRHGEDWIDEFARTSTIDEFRGAMRFTLGKYNRRAGKKDELISEIRKMRDYCDRWISYEEGLNE